MRLHWLGVGDGRRVFLRTAPLVPVPYDQYVPERCLIPPFTSIPGLGSRAAAAIVKARQQGEFESVEDFRRRTGLGKKLCEVLRDHGVFEGLPETAQLALF